MAMKTPNGVMESWTWLTLLDTDLTFYESELIEATESFCNPSKNKNEQEWPTYPRILSVAPKDIL